MKIKKTTQMIKSRFKFRNIGLKKQLYIVIITLLLVCLSSTLLNFNINRKIFTSNDDLEKKIYPYYRAVIEILDEFIILEKNLALSSTDSKSEKLKNGEVYF
ncbi:MAG: hypothetical protein HQK49_01810 [Oligoflexia bacterium]|nr:hypothetical protein [Oligoflexia bacterium]